MEEYKKFAEEKLGLKFHDINLLITALTHRSYVNEHKAAHEHNERLEFLGDAILDFLVGEYLYKTRTDLLEGQMTKLRAEYVCEQANAEYTLSLKLNDLIMVGVGAKRAHEENNKSVFDGQLIITSSVVCMDQTEQCD